MKKQLQKFLSVALALTACFSVVGCSGKAEDGEEKAVDTTKAQLYVSNTNTGGGQSACKQRRRRFLLRFFPFGLYGIDGGRGYGRRYARIE